VSGMHFTAVKPVRRGVHGLTCVRAHLTMSSDYVSAASGLFANVRLPASILAGALVPLGFGFVLPSEGPAFSPETRRFLIRLHRVAAAIAYSCLLICIVYASVSINSLAEMPHEKAESVIALIRQEYELPWVATNVTFFLGLCGALVLVALRALLTWEPDEGKVAAGFCASALLIMASVVDDQVKLGGYSENLVQLMGFFFQMLFEHATQTQSPLLLLGLVLSAGSSFGALSLIASPIASTGGGRDGVTSVPSFNARALSTSQVDAIASSVGDTDTMSVGGEGAEGAEVEAAIGGAEGSDAADSSGADGASAS